MIDTSASYHVIPLKDFFTSYKSRDFGVVRTCESGTSKIVRMGDVCIETNVGCKLILKDVMHVLDLCLNLIPTKNLEEEDYNNHFGGGQWKLTKGSLVVVRGKRSCTLCDKSTNIQC